MKTTDHRLDRREAIKWMLTVAGSLTVLGPHGIGAVLDGPIGRGYGPDPDLLKDYKPGDLWPLTLTEAQRRTVMTLCDVIIPAAGSSPAASALRVPEFIDEWISAPYDWIGKEDRSLILEGIEWLDIEAKRRYGAKFSELIRSQQHAICDEICYEPAAKPGYEKAAHFFSRFRDLTAGGYYTTAEGMKDINYVGNIPMPSFEGPPAEVLKILGL